MAEVRIVVHRNEIEAIKRSPQMRDVLMDVTEQQLLPDAQQRAPKRTGAGAASIHAEPVLEDDEWTTHTSWDRDHFYMWFPEKGTVHQPARPFLVPALEGLG